MLGASLGLVAFVTVTGLVHGAEPGHGWPIAAAYGVASERPWVRGLSAAFVLGVGHLVSSVTVVLGFFWLKSAAGLSEVPYLDQVAGVLLVGLGVREYLRDGHHDHGVDAASEADERADGADAVGLAGPTTADPNVDASGGDRPTDHDHDDGHSHDHFGRAHGHSHDYDRSDHDHAGGLRGRVLSALGLQRGHLTEAEAVGGGLWGIAWTAFVLGFAHEEEFELIGICTGTALCVELTLLYAGCVVSALVGLTALLLAGYERYEERVEAYAEQFPTVSAVVLVAMGLGFLAGVF